MDDLLSPERVRARGLFQPAAVEALKAEHVAGRRAHADRLWTLMMAELWLREYLDRGVGLESRVRAAAHPRRRRRLAARRAGRRASARCGSRRAGSPRRGHDVRVLCRAPGRRRRRPRSCARACAIVEFASVRRSPADFLRSTVARRPARGGAPARRAGRRPDQRLPAAVRLRRARLAHRPPAAVALQLPVAGAARVPLAAADDGASPRGRGRRRRRWPRCGWRSARACAGPRAIHVMSDFSVSLLWRLYRIPAERTVKIPGGVDVERFQPGRATGGRCGRALGLPLDGPLLLTVRNLEARMGLDTLIARHGRARAPRRPSVRLLIGGAGSHRAALERAGGRSWASTSTSRSSASSPTATCRATTRPPTSSSCPPASWRASGW